MKKNIFDWIDKCNSKEELLKELSGRPILKTPVITRYQLILRDKIKHKLTELERKNDDRI